MTASQKFFEIYQKEPDAMAFTPYRICPLGAHVDHQLGWITGLAIDRGIHIAYGAKQNGVVEIRSMQFDKRAQWHVASVPSSPEGDWADHLRGATKALAARYTLRVGVCAVIQGELPIGGLSSSAAVIITFLSALAKVNGISISEREMIEISREAENEYVGVACGKLDQSCEVYCKKNHLLYMDMKDDTIELVPEPENMKPYKIAIFFSGLERSLAASKYNMRTDECRAAAYSLLAYAGMDYGKISSTNLRDVPYEVFVEHGHKLPDSLRRRAEHWFGEIERVRLGVEAWRKGDIEEFGRLVFESGRSSIDKYEAGSPELKRMYEIMCETDGIYGGRFSGAGFKGCCMALIDPSREAQILESVKEKYCASFPHLADKYSAHVCVSADGVKL